MQPYKKPKREREVNRSKKKYIPKPWALEDYKKDQWVTYPYRKFATLEDVRKYMERDIRTYKNMSGITGHTTMLESLILNKQWRVRNETTKEIKEIIIGDAPTYEVKIN